ncbi:MAG TPA: penicillin-binding protein 2 [Solirubrobacteraceae bacterium]|nr:penicillin-binding protein 2 [Solirubrobacteraceae bacterium]
MIQIPEDRRPPMTPQLALRVAIVGSVALAFFAIIFFRLWFLQVLSGEQYVRAATVNRVRDVAVPAERGEILDRTGNVLVDSRQALAVQISPTELPKQPAEQRALYRRLALVLSFSTRRERCVVPGVGTRRLARIPCDVAKQLAILPYANVTLKTDVPRQVQYYLAERQTSFPGVVVQKIYVRNYPLGGLAAQLFGTVGPINAQELKSKTFRGVSPNATVGQSGIEYAYDQFLRGTDGQEKITVDAQGRPTGQSTVTAPVAGHNLSLSLSEALQRVGQQSLQRSIDSNYPAPAGAFVAMNPQNGQIYAMGSLPTFNPGVFTTGNLSQRTYDQLTSPAAHEPLLNRAIAGVGPTGSTFKPITATAALESGAWTTGSIYDDTGSYKDGALVLHNAGHAVYGPIDLVNAIRVSSDTFFYNLGARTNVSNPLTQPQGGPLQMWARRYGIGHPTGLDIGGEASGTLPTPAWRERLNAAEAACDNLTHPTRQYPHHPDHRLPPGGCGIADGTNRPWSVGDNVNLAVGQGDVQVTPLQLAVVYAAVANGGTIVRPHVGLNVQNQDGTVLQDINPAPSRHIAINPFYLDTIRQGLHEAAQSPGGTSDAVFQNFPLPVYGKTGTAQLNGLSDTAWYACFVPATATSKPIVVVVHVEQGGFGAVAAAPVARQILSQWFFGKPGPYVAGSSHTL